MTTFTKFNPIKNPMKMCSYLVLAAVFATLLPSGVTQAASVAEAAPADAPPQRMSLFNQKYAAVAVQTEKDVNFVLVHVGFLSTGMQDWVTHERTATNWGFKGNVHLVDSERMPVAGHHADKREIAVKYTSSEPDTLYLDGKTYALNTSGRIFILRDMGEPVQVERTLPLRNKDDLVKLGIVADAELLKLGTSGQAKGASDPAIQPAPAKAKDDTIQFPIRSPQMGTNATAEEVETAKRQGAETAAQDIKAGVFRILYYGEPFPTGKPLVDTATGYRTQIVAGCIVSSRFVAEADAYNQAMRDWHAKKSPKKN